MSASRFNAFVLAIITVTLSACASQPPPQYAPINKIPAGTTVHVIAHVPDVSLPDAQSGLESTGGRAAKYAGQGAAAGAVEATKASVGCGPFVLFCAPFFAVVLKPTATGRETGHGMSGPTKTQVRLWLMKPRRPVAHKAEMNPRV